MEIWINYLAEERFYPNFPGFLQLGLAQDLIMKDLRFAEGHSSNYNYDFLSPLLRQPLFRNAYDYKGTVFCHCPVTGKSYRMAYCGFEKDRNTLKYTCLAKHYGVISTSGKAPLI